MAPQWMAISDDSVQFQFTAFKRKADADKAAYGPLTLRPNFHASQADVLQQDTLTTDACHVHFDPWHIYFPTNKTASNGSFVAEPSFPERKIRFYIGLKKFRQLFSALVAAAAAYEIRGTTGRAGFIWA